jgi:hypothetical protein
VGDQLRSFVHGGECSAGEFGIRCVAANLTDRVRVRVRVNFLSSRPSAPRASGGIPSGKAESLPGGDLSTRPSNGLARDDRFLEASVEMTG